MIGLLWMTCGFKGKWKGKQKVCIWFLSVLDNFLEEFCVIFVAISIDGKCAFLYFPTDLYSLVLKSPNLGITKQGACFEITKPLIIWTKKPVLGWGNETLKGNL